MRILVTGGCGFIGSNFIRYLFSEYKDVRVINLDKLTYCGNPDNLEDLSGNMNYRFVKGDICDGSLVEDLVGEVDHVVNFAAETHVDRSIKYPDDFVRTNVFGVKTLLEACRKKNLARFVQVSTDEVYGDIEAGFSKEDDLLRPNSPYAATKASGDLLSLSYFRTYGFPVVIVRSSNNFGPYQYPEKAMPLFITNLVEGKKVPVYGDGNNVRDWLFVEDNCRGIDAVLRKGRTGEVYNIGGGNQVANIDMVRKILSLMGRSEKDIVFVKDRPGHDRRYALDSSKVKKLGWEPAFGFEEGIKRTVAWYTENRKWWQSLKQKAEIIEW